MITITYKVFYLIIISFGLVGSGSFVLGYLMGMGYERAAWALWLKYRFPQERDRKSVV